MSESVTEVMTPPPPDPLHEWLKVAGMSTSGTTRFMETHQIVTIDDMLLFCPSKSQYLTKI